MTRQPGRVRRWAAILLPFVIGARALLLVHQLHNEHKTHTAASPPAWPASVGEVLHFRSDSAGLRDWAAQPGHTPLHVALLERDFLPAAPDTGCLLDPAAMGRHGGTLTLASQDAQDWTATWSGGATILSLDEAGRQASDPVMRRTEEAISAAADCGGHARVQLTGQDVHVLANLLAGQPPPPPDPAPRHRTLYIRVNAPAP